MPYFSPEPMVHPTHPSDIFQTVRAYHTYQSDLTDSALDALLNLHTDAAEPGLNDWQLQRRYGLEQFTYEGTPYSFARDFLHKLNPTENDTIYDLGAGYGRVVLYSAMVTPAHVKGIEIVPERVAQAQSAIEKLQLPNAQFTRGNVCDQQFGDGTIFFLFNPFADYAFWWTMDQLKGIAADHPIKIVTWGGGLTNKFAEQPWLTSLSGQSQGINPNITWVKLYASQ